MPIGDLDEHQIEYETLILEKCRKEFCAGYAEAYLAENGLTLDDISLRGRDVSEQYNKAINHKEFKYGEYNV
ncbi:MULTISPECIES: hypothetical protein [Acinetobacter calcoaceticus/baumannii complex]|uniref:Uncharacterized protein n=3 Tax=Acinetobacter calcoaceticus/baumannii complex TaxID=909768 RepID=A0A009IHH5_ACIB9|nr:MULTISPECIES: hypothetical protein [Acinetobacter calcoaceticus/baumannii complex]KCX92558.1 hypothetical protein J568_2427 [Acinetobacter baumannii 6112]EHU1847560.1 hypothetical protein [Acinetobacter baumannii]EIB7123178.1 hypothetical protein [Acinetobacter baumannii]EKW2154771.1 hypothetical protein [Acinetobacter baumannii]ENU41253.1 hypothetical protein F985_04057 [Acinetobacter seifertii]